MPSADLRIVREMRRTLIAVLAVLASTGPAGATTITVELEDTRAVTPKGQTAQGVKLYTAYAANAVTLTGIVLADNGQPAAGVTVNLSTVVHAGDAPVPLYDVVTAADGTISRSFVPDSSITILAAVTAVPSIPGVAAADAIPIVLGVAPNIELTTPRTQRGQPYRIRGFMDIPQPRTAGRITLRRRSPTGTRYVTIASQRTDAGGRFKFAVTHRRSGLYRYQILFVPTDPDLWIRSRFDLGVRFTKR